MLNAAGEPKDEYKKYFSYYEAFKKIWGFVDTKMIYHQVGEQRRLLDRDGKIIDGSIGNEWKIAYHSGRSMMECDKRLQQLMKK